AFREIETDIGDMLDHFHVEDDVECLPFCLQVLGSRCTVIDRKTAARRMEARDLYVGGGGIGPDNLGAQPRHRLAKQAAAAADVEQAQPLEGACLMDVAAKMRSDAVANIGEPDRVELVQRPELPFRVPPF